MHNMTLRSLLALTTFLFALAWSGTARADVTITGTVGELGVVLPSAQYGQGARIIRFKLTDATQTATCTDLSNGVGATTAKYAYIVVAGPAPDNYYKEWYAALLVSKKGAPISCTITSNQDCHVTSCTLP